MSINISLLKNICEVPGAPGHEQPIRALILETIGKYADEVRVDNMGNVIAIKKGTEKENNKKVMLAAHMDEISFIVNHIDKNGFLRFYPLGGFDPKTLTAQRVIIHGTKPIIGVMGSKPIHLMSPEERGKNLKLQDFFIDTGLSKEEVEAIVSVGDVVTRERELIEMGQCVNCKSIDNRVSVYILLEVFKELQNQPVPYDTYGVFTVQEEVGVRGAIAATLNINPDFALNIDTTIAFDVPGAKPQEQVTALGKGTAIKIMDSSVICDYRMVRYMKKQAEDNNITWQHELLPRGGTDSSALQKFSNRGGSITGGVSIPTRHIHQVIEMANKNDIRGSIDLLKVCLQNLNTYDWNFR